MNLALIFSQTDDAQYLMNAAPEDSGYHHACQKVIPQNHEEGKL